MSAGDIFNIVLALLLGIALGGSLVFWLQKKGAQGIDQVARLRGVSLLEQVAEHIGKVSHVFSKYASLVIEIGPHPERMSSAQQRELEALSNDLVRVYEEVSVAESKLLLLGEQRLEKALKLYTVKMAQFRKQIYPGRYQNADDAGKLRKEVTEMKEQFYTILSERYDQKIG